MSRWPILLLVLCALTGGLVACGGDDSDDVDKILSETFGEGKDVKSGRLDVSLRLNAKGLEQLQGPLGVRLTGPFESTKPTELPRFDFEASVDTGGQQIKAGAVSTGDKGFLKLQDQAYDLGDDLYKQFKDGYAQTAKCTEQEEGGGGSFAALGVNPESWLVDAENVGEEEVAGAETTHITGKVDVPKFLEDVNRILARSNPQQQADPCAEQKENQPKPKGSRQLSAKDRKAISDAVKDARVDIWSGNEDRMLRRMNVALKFVVPEAERQKAGGLESGDLRFDMTLGALNEKQTINAPENARPLEELTGALTAGTGQPGTGGGAAQPEQPQAEQPQAGQQGAAGSKYQQCLADAGQDVKKLQDCGQLVGQ